MDSELKELEDQGGMQAEGQTALKRHKKMKDEEIKHKENLKKLKQSIKGRKGWFNRKNLNSNFFVNNKKTANEAKGWAFDFGVEESSGVKNQTENFIALPGEGQKLREEKEKLKAEKIQRIEENPQENQSNNEENENDKGKYSHSIYHINASYSNFYFNVLNFKLSYYIIKKLEKMIKQIKR